MIENKRFKIRCDGINAWSIWEDKEVIVFDLFKSDAEILCNLLNELATKCSQLEKENEHLNGRINDYNTAFKLLQDLTDRKIKENKLYKSACEKYHIQPEHLEKVLDDFDEFLEDEYNKHLTGEGYEE